MRLLSLIALTLALVASACSSSVLVTGDPATTEAATDDPAGLDRVTLDSGASDTVQLTAPEIDSQSADDAATELASDEAAADSAATDADTTDETPAPGETEANDESGGLDVVVADEPPAVAADPSPPSEPVAAKFGEGQCYANADWKQQPVVVSCSASHIAEVVSIGELTAGPDIDFPGEQRLKILVGQGCSRDISSATFRLANHVDSDPSHVWPDEARWLGGDRSFVCVVVLDSPATGSLATLHDDAEAAKAETARAEREANLIQLGACYTNEGYKTYPYESVPCTSPHNYEVFHVGYFNDAAGTPNPGLEALGDRARPICRKVFFDKTGVPLGQSVFEWSARIPSPNWDGGDRRFECLVNFEIPISSPLSQLDPRTHGERDSLYKLLVGTCLNGDLSGKRELVDCSEPHNFQVIATRAFDVSDPYPGDDRSSARAVAFCESAVQNARLNTFNASWRTYTLWPSEGSWNAGNGVAVCFAQYGSAVTDNLFG